MFLHNYMLKTHFLSNPDLLTNRDIILNAKNNLKTYKTLNK